MLVLSRKPGEVICIGNSIEITVTKVKGDSVKIGITAPREVQVLRKEILRSEKGPKAQGGPGAHDQT